VLTKEACEWLRYSLLSGHGRIIAIDAQEDLASPVNPAGAFHSGIVGIETYEGRLIAAKIIELGQRWVRCPMRMRASLLIERFSPKSRN
jgi:hypothetical protein